MTFESLAARADATTFVSEGATGDDRRGQRCLPEEGHGTARVIGDVVDYGTRPVVHHVAAERHRVELGLGPEHRLQGGPVAVNVGQDEQLHDLFHRANADFPG